MTSSITLDRIVNKAKRVFNKTAYASSLLTTILSSACDVPNQVFPEDGEEEYSESVEGERESITEGESEREMYESEREGEEGIEEVIESEVEEFIEEGLEECIESEGEGESNGVITFQRTFGGFDHDEARSVIQTNDGGYALAGRTFSFGHTDGDMYLVKTDAQGNLEWEKTFGGSGSDWANDIIQTTDGGFILAGGTRSFGAGERDMYLVKTDVNGNLEWDRTFGGSGIDWANDVKQTFDGGYVLVGRNGSFGAGEGDMYLVKTDNKGNLEWDRTFGGSDDDWASSVVQATDGDYVLAGGARSFGAGECDMYLVKIDENGNELWSKTFGGAASDYARAVQQIPNEGYILAGQTSSFGASSWDIYLVMTANNGIELWSKTLGGPGYDFARGVQHTTDGGYILAGSSLVKTDIEGNLLWEKTFDGFFSGVQRTTDGGYVVGGTTNSSENGDDNMYLVKTDQNGNSPDPP